MNNKVLVLFPRFGLSNRLRAIASAKILADYTGRKLCVNWIPSNECNVTWGELFTNQIDSYPISLSDLKDNITLYDERKNWKNFYWDMPEALTNNESDIVAVHTCLNFRIREMSHEMYKTAKSLFYRSLQPVRIIQNIVNDMEKHYFKGNEVVGIHIRRTDFPFYLPTSNRDLYPTRLFIQEMENILKTNPKTKFFLSTDAKEDEKIFKSLFRDNLIVYEKTIICRDTVKGMQDALVDWLLLSRTAKIIGSYLSSFTIEAGAVNMIETIHVRKLRYFLQQKIKEHHKIIKREGLKRYFFYSYTYSKRQIMKLFKNYLR